MLPVSLDIYAEVKGASTSHCIKILINISKCLLYQELFCGNTNLWYSIKHKNILEILKIYKLGSVLSGITKCVCFKHIFNMI